MSNILSTIGIRPAALLPARRYSSSLGSCLGAIHVIKSHSFRIARSSPAGTKAASASSALAQLLIPLAPALPLSLLGDLGSSMTKILAGLLTATFMASTAMPALAAQASAPTPPVTRPAEVDPVSLEMAHQILDIGYPPARRSEMFASVMKAMTDQARANMAQFGLADDKDFQAVLDRTTQRMWDQMSVTMSASLPDIFESMAHAYARLFSREDLAAMLAFAKTPAGQHFFQRSPGILTDPDVTAANQRVMTKLMAKLPDIVRQNRQDIEDYVAKKQKMAPDKPVT